MRVCPILGHAWTPLNVEFNKLVTVLALGHGTRFSIGRRHRSDTTASSLLVVISLVATAVHWPHCCAFARRSKARRQTTLRLEARSAMLKALSPIPKRKRAFDPMLAKLCRQLVDALISEYLNGCDAWCGKRIVRVMSTRRREGSVLSAQKGQCERQSRRCRAYPVDCLRLLGHAIQIRAKGSP
jgi:hypothetical protein